LLVRVAGRIANCAAIRGHSSQRAVDEIDTVGTVEERDANVSARLAAVGIVADERIVQEGEVGPPALAMALTILPNVTSAAVTVEPRPPTAPLLSWIS